MNKQEASEFNLFRYCHGNEKKPLELYVFLDPLCPECWGLEPIIKKLKMEYGQYFAIKHVLSGKLASLNLNGKKHYENIAELWEKTATRSGMSCDGTLWFKNPISSPYIASIAIKAAELQGKKAGLQYLRKLQEVLFIENQDITNIDILKSCAEFVGLDVEEFMADLHSDSAANAFQCDLKITAEMEVHEIPSLVFFNENIEEEGIKVTGFYTFEVYEQILMEMLPERPRPAPLPQLETFLKYFNVVATKEIAVVYNMTEKEVNREMKKLQLKQIAEQIPAKHGHFWKYTDPRG